MPERTAPTPLQRLTGLILLGLLLLLVVVVFIPGTPERRTQWASIVLAALVIGLVLRWLLDLYCGWAASRTNRWYSREREPGGYWMMMAVNGGLTLAAVGIAIRMLY